MYDLTKAHYIGDGLYVVHDGWQFILIAPREHGQQDHVALESVVLTEFLQYVADILRLKITTVSKDGHEWTSEKS